MLGYLSSDIICSSKLTAFLELFSWKTVCVSEQIMSAYKYPSIFSCQMEAIVYILMASWEKIYSALGRVAKRRSPIWNIFSPNMVNIMWYCCLKENIFCIGRSRKATEPNTEYIFSQRRQYNVVLPPQNYS